MSNIDDPYKILGVSPNASDDEIKRHIGSLAGNIILMQIRETHLQTLLKKSLRRFRQHTAG